MGTILWWTGDAVLILVVFPLAMALALRIIRGLTRAHRALVSIGQSAQEVTTSLPVAMAEVSMAAQSAEALRPARTPATTR